jgi:hypothetical protein
MIKIPLQKHLFAEKGVSELAIYLIIIILQQYLSYDDRLGNAVSNA